MLLERVGVKKMKGNNSLLRSNGLCRRDVSLTWIALLSAELERVDFLIHIQVERYRRSSVDQEEYKGLYITEQEVDDLQCRPLGLPIWAVPLKGEEYNQQQKILNAIEANVQSKRAKGAEQGVTHKLQSLERAFSLSDFDRNVLLICLAPELDLRYEKLYSYLQDDVTKKYPTVDLVLNLLSNSLEDKIKYREYLSGKSPLIRYGFIELFEEASQQNPSFLAKYIKLDPYIANTLLTNPDDSRAKVDVSWDALLIPENAKERLSEFVEKEQECFNQNIFYLYGPIGVGKRTCITALCEKNNMGVTDLDVSQWTPDSEETLESKITYALRNARINNSALHIKNFDKLLEDSNQKTLASIVEILDNAELPILISACQAWVPLMHLNKHFIAVNIPAPSFEYRQQLWARQLEKQTLDVTITSEEIAAQFRLTPGQIARAASQAKTKAYWRNAENPCITRDDLLASCREQSSHKLNELAQKITPRYGWDDIVLPPKKLKHLKDVYSAAKNRSKVFEQWGFDKKLSLGKGINVLFSGPSGTGKTMSAEIIAKELGQEFYKIDLSGIVSKYIGETEKNLSKIFNEAEATNAILFFDEADALFGKRSEVNSSHDRHANIETAYLLQKMEEYNGIVILATNLDKNMDNAFTRRINFLIDFPVPKKEDRLRIWQKVWPEALPLADDVDLEYLATNFELSGGNIKNVALNTAFLAAEEGDAVCMKHLVQALQREHQKMGKLSNGKEFGEYQHYANIV